jgi:DNA-binding LacI/PurR family transcriptional regulator
MNDSAAHLEQMLAEIVAQGHRRMVALKEVFPEDMAGVVSSRLPDWNRPPLQCTFETLDYWNPAQARGIVERHMRSSEPPTVFLVYGYELTLEVRHTLKSLGHSVPRDVSIVSLATPPGPSAFHQLVIPAAEIGAEATRMLFTLLAGHVPPERVARIPTKIWPGETLGEAVNK